MARALLTMARFLYILKDCEDIAQLTANASAYNPRNIRPNSVQFHCAQVQ